MEEWSYLGAEMPSIYTSRVYFHSQHFSQTNFLSEDLKSHSWFTPLLSCGFEGWTGTMASHPSACKP
jgi:hypothetical protein